MSKSKQSKSKQKPNKAPPAQAVKAKPASTLSNIVKTVASTGASFLPGPLGGIVGKLLGSKNDPIWWSAYKSGGITLNQQLRMTAKIPTVVTSGSVGSSVESRPYLLEICSATPTGISASAYSVTSQLYPSYIYNPVVELTSEHIQGYAMQEIRKTLNAVPMQTVTSYGSALSAAITLKAISIQLKRMLWEIENQTPHVPPYSILVPALRPSQFTFLQALDRRLDVYLNASIRLPHTLIEYLTWRYGHVFRSNPSYRAARVVYNVHHYGSPISKAGSDSIIDASIAPGQNYDNLIDYNDLVNTWQAVLATNAPANADIFNAYRTHAQIVTVNNGDNGIYDPKEFVLRTNLDVGNVNGATGFNPNLFIMDSELPIDETFIASVVSADVSATTRALFPIRATRGYLWATSVNASAGSGASNGQPEFDTLMDMVGMARGLNGNTSGVSFNAYSIASTTWPVYPYNAPVTIGPAYSAGTPITMWVDLSTISGYLVSDVNSNNTIVINQSLGVQYGAPRWYFLLAVILCKGLDLYNADIGFGVVNNGYNTHNTLVDVSAVSIDAGLVTGSVLQITQTLAWANLIRSGRRDSSDVNTRLEKAVTVISENQGLSNTADRTA